MIKFARNILLSTLSLLVISPSIFAADEVPYGQPDKRVIYTMNGTSGFVFNQIKPVSQINSQGYEMIFVDSSVNLSKSQINQLQNYLNQGGTIIVDAKAGTATAQNVAKSIAGFSINSEAIMISKSSQPQGGYNVTPISSAAFGSKASTGGDAKVANTVNDVFGL